MRTDSRGGTTSRRLPTFLLIGAMKAGTTSLYHYLSAHPQVVTSRYKAPEFFVEESNWHRGIDWYRRQFPAVGPDILAIGEASNVYTKYPRYRGVPERIAAHLPDVRLIYAVREPVARIRSHYQTRVAEGSETAPFAEAVFADPIYLDYSRYALQMEQYLEHFPREQLLVITSEDLRTSREDTMRKVYEFIRVDPNFTSSELDRDFYRTKDRAVRSPLPLPIRKSLNGGSRRPGATRSWRTTCWVECGGSRAATAGAPVRRSPSPSRTGCVSGSWPNSSPTSAGSASTWGPTSTAGGSPDNPCDGAAGRPQDAEHRSPPAPGSPGLHRRRTRHRRPDMEIRPRPRPGEVAPFLQPAAHDLADELGR
jgi:hypothetical protein